MNYSVVPSLFCIQSLLFSHMLQPLALFNNLSFYKSKIMPKAKEHSMEVKKIVLAMHNDGKGYGKISKELKLPKSTVQSIIKKVKDVGHLENLPRSGCLAKVSSTDIQRVVREVNKNPRVTRDEVRSILEQVSVDQL